MKLPRVRAKATMAPILDDLADGRDRLDAEIQEAVARRFRLTKAERIKQKNKIPVYKNRTAWGLVYLQNTKYLSDTRPYIKKVGERRSGEEIYRITAAGKAAQIDRRLDSPS